MALTRPRFRRDLIAVPTEVDGIAYVDVKDPKGGEPFRFYDFEYKVALAFDGLPFDRVVPWVRFSAGLELSEDQLREFAEELGRKGFLEEREGVTPTVEMPVPSPAHTLAFTAAMPVTPSPSAPPEPVPSTPAIDLAAALAPYSVEPAASESAPSPTSTPVSAAETADEFAFEPTVASGRALSKGKPDEVPTPMAAVSDPPIPVAATMPAPQGEPREAEPLVEQPAPIEAPMGVSLAEEMVVVASPVPPTMDDKAMEAAKRAAEMAKLWDSVEDEEEGGLPPIDASPPPPTYGEGEVALPAWMSPIAPPPAIMTPVPVTFGPVINAEAPSVVTVRRRRQSFLLFASMGVLAGTLVFVLTWQLLTPNKAIPLPKLRTFKVEPSTVHRFYSTPSDVIRAEGKVFVMPVEGKVFRLPTVGARVVPGDVLGQTEKAKPMVAQLARLRERLAYNTQLRDTLRGEGNVAETAAQEGKIAERNAQISRLLQSLSNLVPVADVGGEVEAVLAEEGADLAAGAPVVRLRSAGFRARFSLTRPEVNRAKRERLCYLWIGDRLIECVLANGSDSESFIVAEVAETKVGDGILGRPARLIRALYRNAVEVPARAVIHGESSDRVWLVSPRGRVEPRPVTVAESDDESAILVQGLDGGDLVVAAPLPSLSAGALIRASTPETYIPKSP